MAFSIDDLFTPNETPQSEVLASSAPDIEESLPEPGSFGSGRYIFAVRSWRLSHTSIMRMFNNRVLVEDMIGYFEELAEMFKIVLDNFDCVLNHSAIKICIYDNCVYSLTPEIIDQYLEKSWFVTPDTSYINISHTENWIIFSADVKFDCIQSLMRFMYSIDNCFAISGISYPADVDVGKYDWDHEMTSQYGEMCIRDAQFDNYLRYTFPKRLHTLMSHIGNVPIDDRQYFLRDMMTIYRLFNDYVPSYHTYEYLCRWLRTDLSPILMSYAVTLKTQEFLQHINELNIDFYIKNKFDNCTIDVNKAIQKPNFKCFFVSVDIGVTDNSRDILDFGDKENPVIQELNRRFEEQDMQMKIDGSRFVVAEHMSFSAYYLITIFRIGAIEVKNPFYIQEEKRSEPFAVTPINSSPTTIKEVAFVVSTKLTNLTDGLKNISSCFLNLSSNLILLNITK